MNNASYMLKRELAVESRESVSTWERRIRRGELPFHKMGRRVLISRADFEVFMAAHRQQNAPADVRAKLLKIAEQALAAKRRAS
jgi:excisionase family DNA binding protein